jgi:fatty-acyl-CoA synthase
MAIFDLTSKALDKARQYAERGAAELHYLQKMIASGAFGMESPQNFAALGADVLRWGEIGMIPALNARRNPNRTAIIDDEGSMNFVELNDAVNATANGLLAMGVTGGDGVAILARNHRWFLIANYACGRIGARIILLNTEFSGPQIRDVTAREGGKIIIYDDEYSEAVKLSETPLGKLRALASNPDAAQPSGSTDETLADLIARSSKAPAPKATRKASIIVLTSGTTGTPKGANRHAPPTLAPIGGVLSRVPFKAGEVTALPSPMFHALGYLHATLAMTLGSTLILHRRFKPAEVLEDVSKYKVTAIVVVPVMLSRMLDALEAMERKPDMSSLRIIFASGSQLGAELATRAMKDIGPVIYNLYGSTEIAFVSIAGPQDLKKNPATVGPTIKGVKVKILDEHGHELSQGKVGRIFVGNFFPFEGYTGGGGKEIIDGLMSSGDVGYFDESGLLYVSGRDDEMIVSGGENVFPAEVEDLISGHPDVIEATAIGVDDKDFGQRLRAFVVVKEGAVLTEEAIKDYVRDHLARYKVPREVLFLSDLPRNPTGKILKRELRQIEIH